MDEELDIVTQCRKAYDNHRAYLRRGAPRDVMIDDPIMREFRGNIYSHEEVREYLLTKVPPEKREELLQGLDDVDIVIAVLAKTRLREML